MHPLVGDNLQGGGGGIIVPILERAHGGPAGDPSSALPPF